MDAPAPPDEGPIGWTRGRVAAAAVIVFFAGFWAWAFSPWAPRDKPNAVADQAFLADAEVACQKLQDGLAELPLSLAARTAEERAAVIDRAGPLFDELVLDLRAAAMHLEGDEAQLVDWWITDWEVYAADRLRYADALRDDSRAVFIVSQRQQGGQITKTMDGFTRVNDLKPCLVPNDV